jgi:SAM-dependent methyltransferase
MAEPLAQQPAEHNHHHKDQAYQHQFEGAEVWAKEFDDPGRDAWQKPDEILDALDLQRTSYVADLGAGTGYFSARIAKRVPQGKVFAIDVEPDMLRYLRERAQREHLDVLVPVLGSVASANLHEPVDLVLIVDTYHHIDNRVAYFAKLREWLRPGGRLAVVDFKAASPSGPPPQYRISPECLTSEVDAAGCSLAASHSFLPRQYFLIFHVKAH